MALLTYVCDTLSCLLNECLLFIWSHFTPTSALSSINVRMLLSKIRPRGLKWDNAHYPTLSVSLLQCLKCLLVLCIATQWCLLYENLTPRRSLGARHAWFVNVMETSICRLSLTGVYQHWWTLVVYAVGLSLNLCWHYLNSLSFIAVVENASPG